MIFGDLLTVFIFAAAPVWLVVRAFRRYRAVQWTASKEMFLARASLALLLLPLAVMAGSAVMVVVEDLGRPLKTVERFLPAWWLTVVIINSSVCVGSLFLASRMKRGSEDIVRERARRSILAAGVYLTIAWLWAMANPIEVGFPGPQEEARDTRCLI